MCVVESMLVQVDKQGASILDIIWCKEMALFINCI